MELPNCGQQCALPACRRLDFLPVVCTACQQCFCTEHTAQHGCVAGGTVLEQLSAEETPALVQGAQTAAVQRCAQPGCNGPGAADHVLTSACTHCKGVFCLRHRHIVCPLQPQEAATTPARAADADTAFAQAKLIVDQQVRHS